MRSGRSRLAGVLLSVLALACGREVVPPHETARAPTASPGAEDPAALALAIGVVAESLRAAGIERYYQGAYDSARMIFDAERRRARSAGDALAEGRAGMWLGLTAYKVADYATARREGEAALAFKRRAGLDAELSQSFNALGLVAWQEGRFADALMLYDSAVQSAHRNKDEKGIARATANIGLVDFEFGHYEAARRGFTRMLTTARAIGDELYQGNALANLAMLDIRLGHPEAAPPLLAEARRHYTAIDYPAGESNALGQLATAWSGMGDLQRALAAADSGLALARATGERQEIASSLEVIADLHAQAGNTRLALTRLRDADSLDQLLGLVLERGTNLRRSAAILLELGEAATAAAKAADALALHQQVGATGEIVLDRLELAQAAAANGDRRRGERESDAALEEARRLGNEALLRDATLVAARLALDGGRAREALQHLAAAPAAPATDWRVADLRAGALEALGRLAEARAEGERAVAALERERASLGIGPLRTTYFSSRAGPFSRLVAIHLARGDTARAFAVAASLPGRSLAERLGGLRDSTGSLADVAEGERLLLRAAVLEQALDTLTARSAADERRMELTRGLTAAYAAYEEHLAQAATRPADGLLGLAPPSLTMVQGSLPRDEALLTYLAGPERLDLFLVRADRVVARNAAIGERALATRVRLARQLLGRGPDQHGALAPLGELHTLLIGPLLAAGALEGITRLTIVPHGPLGALPFAALWDSRAGRFLVEDHVLRYLPAAAVPPRGFARRAEGRGPLVVFVPLPESLPGTVREARAIVRLMPGAMVRSGASTGEAEVRRALAAGRLVHLASHGAHNAQNPLFSRVIVGRDRGGGSGDDGRLDVHEILGLQTTSPLVFLSGCETGLGAEGQDPFAAGGDEGSLAQAFLVAGADRVVATLWRVGDAGAPEVAERFYRHLEAGAPAEVALAAAQRELLSAGRDFTWAAYTVTVAGERKSGSPVRVTFGTP